MVMIGSVKVVEYSDGSVEQLRPFAAVSRGGLDPVDALLSAQQGDHAGLGSRLPPCPPSGSPGKAAALLPGLSPARPPPTENSARGFCVERLQDSEGLAQLRRTRRVWVSAFGDHRFVVLHGASKSNTGRQQLRFELHLVLPGGDGRREVNRRTSGDRSRRAYRLRARWAAGAERYRYRPVCGGIVRC